MSHLRPLLRNLKKEIAEKTSEVVETSEVLLLGRERMSVRGGKSVSTGFRQAQPPAQRKALGRGRLSTSTLPVVAVQACGGVGWSTDFVTESRTGTDGGARVGVRFGEGEILPRGKGQLAV